MNKTIKIVESGNLTEHFKLSEFYCNTDNEMLISKAFIYDFLPTLEEFRKWYNRPITPTSGYRTARLNKAVGGSSNSSHLKSLAVDFLYPAEYNKWTKERKQQFLNNVKAKWTDLAHAKGYKSQVNFYNNRFHLGFGSGRDSFLDYR